MAESFENLDNILRDYDRVQKTSWTLNRYDEMQYEERKIRSFFRK